MTNSKRLWVRPTFGIENDDLVRLPAVDFDSFVKAQEDLIRTEFAGRRMRSRTPRLVTSYYARDIWRSLKLFADRSAATIPASEAYQGADPEILNVNLKVIEALGREVKNAGGKLIVVDASLYFSSSHKDVSSALKDLAVRNEFGYVPLYKYLLEANANGVPTRWPHDAHFNEAGNTILANALYDWVAQNSHAMRSQ